MRDVYKITKILAACLIIATANLAHASLPLSTPDFDDIEYPEDEPPSEALIALGKQLFFDPLLSAQRNMSCASCHNPELGLGDGLKVSLGGNGKKLKRHSPHLYNLAWATTFFWDGRAGTLEEQALMPISNPEEMNLPIDKMINRLNLLTHYKHAFKQAFASSDITEARIGEALAAFMRTLNSVNSPFDQYLAGNEHAVSPAAKRGLKLFEGKAKCIECHDGANFTDDSFHSLGIAKNDRGRGALFNDPSMDYRFKTPGLRNIALTAPYMHDGSIADLESVIRFYNQGGGKGPNKDKLMVPLDLSEREIADLLAFLGALTDPVKVTRPNLPKH